MITKAEVINLITKKIPSSKVFVENLKGNDHLQVTVIASEFNGLESISFCILSFVRLSIIQFGVSVFNASAWIASEANSSFKAEYTSWCCLTNDNPLNSDAITVTCK